MKFMFVMNEWTLLFVSGVFSPVTQTLGWFFILKEFNDGLFCFIINLLVVRGDPVRLLLVQVWRDSGVTFSDVVWRCPLQWKLCVDLSVISDDGMF